jgi:hypothetical protein
MASIIDITAARRSGSTGTARKVRDTLQSVLFLTLLGAAITGTFLNAIASVPLP